MTTEETNSDGHAVLSSALLDTGSEATKGRKYTADNWAHMALLDMDDADTLVRWVAVRMGDQEKYRLAAEAFWRVAKLLAVERDRLHDMGSSNAISSANRSITPPM